MPISVKVVTCVTAMALTLPAGGVEAKAAQHPTATRAYDRVREKTRSAVHAITWSRTQVRVKAYRPVWRGGQSRKRALLPAVLGRFGAMTYATGVTAAEYGRQWMRVMPTALRQAVRQHRRQRIATWRIRARHAVAFARKQRGRPYVRGGNGRRGYDCSGLVQRSWAKAGVALPRMTYAQYRRIRPRVSRRELRPGDLVFFNGLGHVGLYVGHARFVHSPRPGRRVTTEPLQGYWRKRMVGAVRPAWPRLPVLRMLRIHAGAGSVRPPRREMVEDLGIGQRIGVGRGFDRGAEQNLPYRNFELLARKGAWNPGNSVDLVGQMAG